MIPAGLALALLVVSRASAPAPRAMLVAPAPHLERVVARRNDDGTIVTTCVASPEAAERFVKAGGRAGAAVEK